MICCVAAARALRGANTRTNFVPAMACEGATAPASKAARLIRLRQMAAAAKGAAPSEKEASARNEADSVSQRSGEDSNCKVEPQVNDSPALVRQDLQESVTSSLDDPPPLPSTPLGPPAVVDEHTPPPSPPKPPRLIGRRHNVAPQLPLPKLEEEDHDAPPFAPVHDHGTVDNGSKPYHVESVALPSLSKLEPQQSITSENLSNAINHSLSPQDSSSPLTFPSPRSSFECVQASQAMADGDLQSVNMVASSDHHVKSVIQKERFLIQRPPALESSAFTSFSMENLVAPLPFHGLEAPLLMLRSDHTIISGLVAFSHHQLSSSCASNRDHVSVFPCEKDEVICRGMSLRSCAMSFEEENPVTATETEKCCIEPRAAAPAVLCKGMDYDSSEALYRMETERKSDKFILREKEFTEIVPEIPWADYVLMDETAMEPGLLGLDLSCENSGVYTSAFDFSAEAIDRDSCTSVMLEHEHLSDESEFLLRMQYEHSSNSPSHNFPHECVLLTEDPPELDYTMMSPPRPQETHISSSLWRLDDANACWDGQSSTETADVKASGVGDGECTSQDHEALWSSMDLPPLCMVA